MGMEKGFPFCAEISRGSPLSIFSGELKLSANYSVPGREVVP